MEAVMHQEAAASTRLPESANAFDIKAYAGKLPMLSPGYICPRCHGQGLFYDEETDTAHFCVCRPVRKALSELRRQNLDQSARELTFLSFDAREPWQQKMLETAMAYAASEEPGWLYLGGQTGCGKTHLGTAAAVALALRGRDFLYMPWAVEVFTLKAMAMEEGRGRRIGELINAPVLYIDDLFKAAPTDADKHIAFEILSARYTRRDRPTIISSERTLAELLEIDEALAGRIAERCGRDFILTIPRDRRKNHRFADLL